MPREVELDNGRVLGVTAVLEAMDMLGCSADDLDYWLEHGWVRHHVCEHCGTAWPLLDDVVAIMHLAERNPQVGLYELVHKLHIENAREARQRQLERRTASLAPMQKQADRDTDPRQRSYGRRQETVVEPARGPRRARQPRPEELETRSYTTFEAELPEEYADEDRSRGNVLPRQEPRRGLFGRRQR